MCFDANEQHRPMTQIQEHLIADRWLFLPKDTCTNSTPKKKKQAGKRSILNKFVWNMEAEPIAGNGFGALPCSDHWFWSSKENSFPTPIAYAHVKTRASPLQIMSMNRKIFYCILENSILYKFWNKKVSRSLPTPKKTPHLWLYDVWSSCPSCGTSLF